MPGGGGWGEQGVNSREELALVDGREYLSFLVFADSSITTVTTWMLPPPPPQAGLQQCRHRDCSKEQGLYSLFHPSVSGPSSKEFGVVYLVPLTRHS